MKSDILVILPTRERPAAALKALSTILETSQGRVDVVLCQDEDDGRGLMVNGRNVTTLVGTRKSFTQWLNEAAVKFCEQYPIIGWSADDIRYVKPYWDFTVRQSVRSLPVGIVYGPDGIQNENLPTHPFVTSTLIRALGHLISPKLLHYYNDNYLKELGTRLGCLKYLPEFRIEHQHHSTGKSRYDSLTAANESHYAEDSATFAGLTADIEADVEKVRRYLTGAAAAPG